MAKSAHWRSKELMVNTSIAKRALGQRW